MTRRTLAMLLATAVTALPGAAAANAQTRRPAPAPRAAIAAEAHTAVAEARAAAVAEIARDFELYTPTAPLPPAPAMAPMPPESMFDVDVDVDADVRRAWGSAFHIPPSPWARGDPADSLYRMAREALNRGDNGRAARMFADIQQKYPKSAYASDAQFYEAYARYRIGTTTELQTASRVLEPLATALMNVSNSGSPAQRMHDDNRHGAGNNEVAALYARINGVLAQRGDRTAAAKVARVASAANFNGSAACDNEDIQVRVAAMNALSQTDPKTATPLLEHVLGRKDECSSQLRRRAVFMLGRRPDSASAQLLINTAKSDPSPSVRAEAIGTLPRLSGDAGVRVLEDMLRTEHDGRLQRTVVRSLAESDNASARSSIRALIDRSDTPASLRVEAISTLYDDHATTEDAAYLRGLYGRTDEDRIKEAIIGVVSRMGGAENDRWVLSIAQNPRESSHLRATAVSRLVRSSISITDLSRLYDSAESNSVRTQIVGVLSRRKEPQATDKLIDIVRNSTVLSVRSQAINALVRKNDPRGVKLLTDILDGRTP